MGCGHEDGHWARIDEAEVFVEESEEEEGELWCSWRRTEVHQLEEGKGYSVEWLDDIIFESCELCSSASVDEMNNRAAPE
jgi:hypothetical protein